jgi:hypothetical protein
MREMLRYSQNNLLLGVTVVFLVCVLSGLKAACRQGRRYRGKSARLCLPTLGIFKKYEKERCMSPRTGRRQNLRRPIARA